MTHEFTPWPKTARLYRTVTITEKLDGTNAAIHFDVAGNITTQSRKRVIDPGNDNYGFARWAHAHAGELFPLLGPGLHFGEWWGAGIQRGYGLRGKHFALFNTHRHVNVSAVVGASIVDAVPILYTGTFSEGRVTTALSLLARYGSVAAPGFMQPEGVCVYHSASRDVYKVTLDNMDAGKWEGAGNPLATP